MFDEFLLRESVASVALSHDEGCRCLTCRAALGDPIAWQELMIKLYDERRLGGRRSALQGESNDLVLEERSATD